MGNKCKNCNRVITEGFEYCDRCVLDSPKPPLGIMPAKLFYESRLNDLAAAVNRRISSGYNYLDPMIGAWLQEMVLLASFIRRHHCLHTIEDHK